MKQIVWLCDCCGRELSGLPIRMEAYTIDRESEEPQDTFRQFGEHEGGRLMELCEECVKDIFATMYQHIVEQADFRLKKTAEKMRGGLKDREETGKETEEGGTKVKKKKENAKGQIDQDTLQTLWEAGWTVQELCTEFRCSDEAIVQNLKKLGIYKTPQEREEERRIKREAEKAGKLKRLELNVIEEEQ